MRRCADPVPTVVGLTLDGSTLVVVHGHQYPQARQRHEALRRDFALARAITYGHSHRLVIDDAAEPWVLNPGACGRARVGAGASALSLRIDGPRWRVRVIGPCPSAAEVGRRAVDL